MGCLYFIQLVLASSTIAATLCRGSFYHTASLSLNLPNQLPYSVELAEKVFPLLTMMPNGK